MSIRRFVTLEICVIVIAMLGLNACDETPRELQLNGAAMGTQFSVTLVVAEPKLSGDNLPEIQPVFDAVSDIFSTYDSNSDVSKFNQHLSTDWFPTSPDFCKTLDDALAISRKTDGAFDPTIGRLVNLWGFGPTEIQLQPPPAEDIELALETIGYAKLHTRCSENIVRKDHPDLYVDLSAYAKGLAVDAVAESLDDSGYTDYLVELGGEIRVRGRNARGQLWRIAIEKPDNRQRTEQSALRITDKAVATSGDYRNFFEHDGVRYSHTIDSQTGIPVMHATASVTVVHQSTAYADAMATALLVMGHDDGFAFAADSHVAAFFLLRNENRYQSLMTAEFATFIER